VKELEELSNGKGKLVEASEEGQDPHTAVEPMMMMMPSGIFLDLTLQIQLGFMSKDDPKIFRHKYRYHYQFHVSE
jgi:hypothetical protein